jgi:hypothetical protein
LYAARDTMFIEEHGGLLLVAVSGSAFFDLQDTECLLSILESVPLNLVVFLP